ncbi:MAG: DivIVA domain-containing protein [Oscillospiraceae bacterium]|nr:DivIVA domain-containing protein [Oscillospiraceae bacterium]
MLTPQELNEVRFDKARFGGYDTDGVDEMMTRVAADYTALFKENAVLKNKLKVLAETVEEYRSVDEAMRKALITAQNMANDMINDAKKKSEEILISASAAAQEKATALSAKIREEEAKLVLVKKATNEFATKMLHNYQSQVSAMQEFLALSETTDEERASLAERMSAGRSESSVPDVTDDFMAEVEKEISEKSLEELGGKDESTEVSSYSVDFAEPAEEEVAEIDRGETKRYDVSQLQFGRNFDINTDQKND